MTSIMVHRVTSVSIGKSNKLTADSGKNFYAFNIKIMADNCQTDITIISDEKLNIENIGED